MSEVAALLARANEQASGIKLKHGLVPSQTTSVSSAAVFEIKNTKNTTLYCND
jgi:hypothetical protein